MVKFSKPRKQLESKYLSGKSKRFLSYNLQFVRSYNNFKNIKKQVKFMWKIFNKIYKFWSIGEDFAMKKQIAKSFHSNQKTSYNYN